LNFRCCVPHFNIKWRALFNVVHEVRDQDYGNFNFTKFNSNIISLNLHPQLSNGQFFSLFTVLSFHTTFSSRTSLPAALITPFLIICYNSWFSHSRPHITHYVKKYDSGSIIQFTLKCVCESGVVDLLGLSAHAGIAEEWSYHNYSFLNQLPHPPPSHFSY